MLIPLDTVETIYYNEVIYKETLKKMFKLYTLIQKHLGVLIFVPGRLYPITYFIRILTCVFMLNLSRLGWIRVLVSTAWLQLLARG